MARRSRKDTLRAIGAGLQPVQTSQAAEKTPVITYNTAAYARLSIFETRDRADSEALQNQKAFIRRFIDERPELCFCVMHEDNGESGTTFSREGFQSLMSDIRERKINCIVVKDLSRFGRDYVEAGKLLEQVFPTLGVRFISINDRYDSADPSTHDNLIVALKNMINHAYSKDISRKSGSVLRQKQKRGEFIGAYASYGYLKDPENGRHIIVDPETAPVVKEIFRRKAAGDSTISIVRWLNDSKIPSPCTYRYQAGIIKDERYAGGKPWLTPTVKRMLTCEVYLGHMVQGRRVSEFYTGRPEQLLPQEQWTVVRDTHEAIISETLFSEVQQILTDRADAYRSNLGKYDHLGISANLMKGLVYCADCGRPLVRYKQVSHGKKVDYYFMCPSYAARLQNSGCAYKYLSEDKLNDAIVSAIEFEVKLAVDMAGLLKMRNIKNNTFIERNSGLLKASRTDLTRLEDLRKKLMKDYLAGIIDEQDYARLKAQYVREEEALEHRINEISKTIEQKKHLLSEKNPWISLFAVFGAKPALTRQLLEALVDRIMVYDNEHLEVLFRFRDERQALLESMPQREVKAG